MERKAELTLSVEPLDVVELVPVESPEVEVELELELELDESESESEPEVVEELDLNPVFAYSDGAIVADARIVYGALTPRPPLPTVGEGVPSRPGPSRRGGTSRPGCRSTRPE